MLQSVVFTRLLLDGLEMIRYPNISGTEGKLPVTEEKPRIGLAAWVLSRGAHPPPLSQHRLGLTVLVWVDSGGLEAELPKLFVTKLAPDKKYWLSVMKQLQRKIFFLLMPLMGAVDEKVVSQRNKTGFRLGCVGNITGMKIPAVTEP